jgi:hypothetical protein
MLGPAYSYADELKTPSELGIGRDGSFDGIMRAVGGINYYVDAIGFGESTMIAKGMGMEQKPLGIRYFVKTGQTCSNGQDMYEYISTVPSGLGGRVGNEVKHALGVDFRGMAPGIIEDSVSALNPMPLFKSVTGSGYARCKKVTLPVGDMNGALRSSFNPANVWIKDSDISLVNGAPSQTRWVFDSYVSMDQYDADPKVEGFSANLSSAQIAAGILLAALCVGMATRFSQ